nr:hypothetical protein B0A51_04180 [Rachicladosporium sp. CCFEE 5018]
MDHIPLASLEMTGAVMLASVVALADFSLWFAKTMFGLGFWLLRYRVLYNDPISTLWETSLMFAGISTGIGLASGLPVAILSSTHDMTWLQLTPIYLKSFVAGEIAIVALISAVLCSIGAFVAIHMAVRATNGHDDLHDFIVVDSGVVGRSDRAHLHGASDERGSVAGEGARKTFLSTFAGFRELFLAEMMAPSGGPPYPRPDPSALPPSVEKLDESSS